MAAEKTRAEVAEALEKAETRDDFDAAPKQDHRETKTEDMFAAPLREAIALLHLAVRECESLGVRVTLSIEE